MNRKLVSILAIFVLAAFVVAGCSTTPATTDKGTAATAVKPAVTLSAKVSDDKKTVTFTGVIKNESDKEVKDFRKLELKTSSAFDGAAAKAESAQEPKLEDVTKFTVAAKSEQTITWTYTLPEPLKDDALKAYEGTVLSVIYKGADGEMVGITANVQ